MTVCIMIYWLFSNSRYIFTLDGMNTKVSFLIKILKFAELGAAELQLQKEHTPAETKALTDQFSLGKSWLLVIDYFYNEGLFRNSIICVNTLRVFALN